MPDLSPSFLKISEEINKSYPGSFRKLSGAPDSRRIPTGVFALDARLGGGVPVNRVTLVCGHKACFKTSVALKIVRNFQERCGACLLLHENCQCTEDVARPTIAVFIDSEHALNEEHTIRFGIDPERFYLVRPPHGEAACEYVEKLAKVPDVGVIIFDSLASIVPSEELKKSFAQSPSRGLRARLINRLMRSLIVNIDSVSSPRTVIMLNHILPMQDGKGDYLPGGETQKYLSSVVIKLWLAERKRIVLSKGGDEQETEFDEDSGRAKKVEKVEPRKQPMGFLIEHSKVSAENLSGEFILWLEEFGNVRYCDTDDMRAVFLYAQSAGMTEKSGNNWIICGNKYSSQTAAFEKWQSDKLEFEQVRRQIIDYHYNRRGFNGKATA